jgi:hypothetical protein
VTENDRAGGLGRVVELDGINGFDDEGAGDAARDGEPDSQPVTATAAATRISASTQRGLRRLSTTFGRISPGARHTNAR